MTVVDAMQHGLSPIIPRECVGDRSLRAHEQALDDMGGRYGDDWHRMHLLDPRSVVPASIMPAYPWLGRNAADRHGSIQARMRALASLGHPYTEQDIVASPSALQGKTELDSVVAYLQSLGRGMDGESQP